jgi:Ser/Thr protein kinase RdoA (MazF antagonist)
MWQFAPLSCGSFRYRCLVQHRSDPQAHHAALAHFTDQPLLKVEPLGDGHLHETLLVRLGGSAMGCEWVLQRINTQVFTDVPAVMSNLERVTQHARTRLLARGVTALSRRVLTLVRTRAGAAYIADPSIGTCRVFEYISGSIALSRAESAADAFEAGRACGEFAALMSDLAAPALHTTLPNFHATDQRFLQLVAAIERDPVGRAAGVASECAALRAREPLARECSAWSSSPELRLRVTHNDTKLNNILFDAATRRALCLVDLDTVMPGYIAYDFGDLVRTCLCTAPEDAHDPAQVGLDFSLFAPLAEGYLSARVPDLTPLELRSLGRGPLWIVLELALRFLTDYLQGDTYFKVARPEHNLDRARTALALLVQLELRERELTTIVERCAQS